MTHQRPMGISVLAFVAFFACGCSNSMAPGDAGPSLVISTPTPTVGSTIHVTVGAAPGLFIPRGSGQLSVPITVMADRDLPWAQLNVYLMTGTDPTSYCGQNLPDSPGWAPFAKGQSASVTVTGFQVFRLPCDVAEIRAYFTTRDTRAGGLLTPPAPSETVASGGVTVNYQLRP